MFEPKLGDVLWNKCRGLMIEFGSASEIGKVTGLMSIVTSKKVWKCLIKIQLTKSDPKGQGLENAHPHAN